MSDPASNSAFSILRLYWDILRLKRGPEDLPVSAALLFITVAARIGLGLLANTLIPQSESHPTALMLIDCVVVLVWGRAVLQLARRPERYLQTLTAVFGCELLLQVLSGATLAAYVAATAAGSTAVAQLAALAIYVIYLWILVAVVRILRSATGWPVIGCIAAVVMQGFVTLAVAVAIFPDLLADMQKAVASGT